MSELEKAEAQGCAALKQTRSLIATLQAELSAFSHELHKLADELDRYARDPLAVNQRGILLYADVRERLEQVSEAGRRLRQPLVKLLEEVECERKLQ